MLFNCLHCAVIWCHSLYELWYFSKHWSVSEVTFHASPVTEAPCRPPDALPLSFHPPWLHRSARHWKSTAQFLSVIIKKKKKSTDGWDFTHCLFKLSGNTISCSGRRKEANRGNKCNPVFIVSICYFFMEVSEKINLFLSFSGSVKSVCSACVCAYLHMCVGELLGKLSAAWLLFL